MKIKDLKTIIEFCKGIDLERDEMQEVYNQINYDESDFEVGNYRFIEASSIDDIQIEELKQDSYILGCFVADAISEATGWPVALIEAAQKGEQYEAVGEAMTDEHITELQRIYQESDGYGHHFNGYDGETLELFLSEVDYYVFRIN